MKRKKLFLSTAVDDDIPIQKLTFSGQLRVLVQHLINEDKEQLKVDDAETVYQFQFKANLLEFPCKTTGKVRQGGHHSVTVSISSRFKPALEDVLQLASISTYYTYMVGEPEIGYDVEYYIQVILEVKSY